MTFSPFSAIGLLLANGLGILLLSALAASVVLVWSWRWALPAAVTTLLAMTTILAALHTVSPLITFSQWLAIGVAGLLLGLAGRLHPAAGGRPNSNWLIRLAALASMLGAWWVIDPGVSLPMFTQVETDLILWIGLCGVLLISLSPAPLHTGIGLLLLGAPLQAASAILLPGSGLTILAGIAQILLALGCAYLTLAQPIPQRAGRQVLPLPGATSLPVPARPPRLRFPKPRPSASLPPGTGLATESSRETHAPAEKSV